MVGAHAAFPPFDGLAGERQRHAADHQDGVAAAWTLIYIEASGVVGVILHPSIVKETIDKGIGHFITQQISSQITTFIDAAIWFSWWPDKGHGPLAWFAVAYAGYTVNGRRKIFALAMDTRLWPQGPAITLDDLLNKIVFDGGCAVLHLRYDVTDGKMDVFSCNGSA